MKAYLFDIIIILLLAFFAWRGAKKGLILTLCSLLGIFVAFFGARYVSAEFYDPVANIIEPPIYQAILGADSEAREEASYNIRNSENTSHTYSLEELLDIIQDSELFTGFTQFLEDAVDNNTIKDSTGSSAARVLADHLSKLIAKAGLFAITFLVIVLVWFLLGHILDLAFKLPVLSAVNWIGGLALGLTKAVLLIIVLVWIGQLAGIIPQEPETPVLSMFTVQRVFSLLNSLVV